MKRAQIKELARSIAVNGNLSDEGLRKIITMFSANELKLLVRLLKREIADGKVVVSFSGRMGEEYKKRIAALFPGKTAEFEQDDGLGAGVKFKYGDFVLDYSVSGMIKRILNNIRESL